MRLRFSDTENLKWKAERNLENGLTQLRRWWSKKYKLPPNHDLFENQSVAEINLEFFEDLMAQRREVLEELDDEETRSEQAEVLFRQLNAINKALGFPEEVQDDLIDEWERELEAGRVPDLNKKR